METEKNWFLRQELDLDIDLVIRRKIKDSTSSDIASSIFTNIKRQLEDFLYISFQNLNDKAIILSEYVKLISNLTEISNTKIVKGESNLKRISSNFPIIIISNHFGIVPLTLIDNSDQKFPWPLKEIGVFPVRLSSLNLLSKKSNIKLFEVATELPEPMAIIQRATPSILIPINTTHKSQILINEAKDVIQNNENAGIIVYPEGGISGKLNHGGPYDLDTFHTGVFLLAKQLNLQILPVCQYFNPNSGFELDILKPVSPIEINLNNLKTISERTQKKMQESLNNLHNN